MIQGGNMVDFEKISELMQRGKAKDVKVLVAEALESGAAANEILEKGLLRGMSVIGEKFKNNEIFVPEVLIAARAMNAGMDVLKPYMESGEIKSRGTVILGTVKGDLHDIGKNLVGMMMKGKGFNVVDIGTDAPVERFIEAARENNAGMIGCSALLTTTMEEMRSVVNAVKNSDLAGRVKVMVGGAPVTPAFAADIGADAYGENAASAAEEACRLFR